jgi:hypothetical protein
LARCEDATEHCIFFVCVRCEVILDDSHHHGVVKLFAARSGARHATIK